MLKDAPAKSHFAGEETEDRVLKNQRAMR